MPPSDDAAAGPAEAGPAEPGRSQRSSSLGTRGQLGRYRLVEPLGAGSFATVWRAVDDELAVEVAIKVLADNWSLNSDVRSRFLEEARVLRRISSPRVIGVYDVGEADGRPYFVMDLIGGGTIDQIDASTSASERLRLAAECARAVAVIHEAGLAHRDVKPSNVLIDRSGDEPRVVVADLGTAKALADGTGFTMTAGTPVYMAPEQAMGGRVDERCDVYSIGVVAFELLTGEHPHDPADLPTGRSAPPAVSRSLGLPVGLDGVLAAALAVDPARRPATAALLADQFEALLDGRDPAAEATAGTWPVAVVFALAFVLLIVSAGVAWWLA